MNLGVRWEYFGPPHNFQQGLDANFYTGVPITPIPEATDNPFYPVNSPYYAGFATGSVQQRNHDLWNKDLNNFGPRLGFAFDTFGNQKPSCAADSASITTGSLTTSLKTSASILPSSPSGY